MIEVIRSKKEQAREKNQLGGGLRENVWRRQNEKLIEEKQNTIGTLGKKSNSGRGVKKPGNSEAALFREQMCDLGEDSTEM